MTDLEIIIINHLTSRDWRLAGPNTSDCDWHVFIADIQHALAQAAPGSVPDHQHLERAVTFAYCPLLYAACADHGSRRQHRAFEEVWNWVFRRVRWRVSDAQDAQDVVQKTLLKIYQNLHQVKAPRGFLGWVSVIMHHEISDHYQRKGKADQFEQELPYRTENDKDTGDRMEDLDGPDLLLAKEIEMAEEDLIRMIFECVPEGQRRRAEVLVALALKGQTVVEVAEILETTPANVHLMYFRARRDLPKHCRHVIEIMLQHLAPSQRRAFMEEGL